MRGSERLKTPQQYVEWCNLEHMLLIQLHSLTNLSPPLISLASLSSFPPGEAKGASHQGTAGIQKEEIWAENMN